MADIGHNSTNVGVLSGDRLKNFIERIERLTQEKDAIAADIREVFAEAKGVGFDTKVMREVIKRRKMDRGDVEEFEALLDVYLAAIGFDTTPLGAAAEDPDPGDADQPAPEPAKPTKAKKDKTQ